MKPGLTDVVYIVDEKPLYREMMLVSLYSLLRSCSRPIRAHVYFPGGMFADARERGILDRIPARAGGTTLAIGTIPRKYDLVLQAAGACTPLGIACCARFLLPIMLEDVGQCLYVDTDTVFTGDPAVALDGFYREWMREASTAGVPDMLGNIRSGDPMHSMPGYVNGGVLLMDLDLWRKRDLAQRLLFDVVTEGRRFNDQDTVNLFERPVHLPHTMNFLSGWPNFGQPIERYNEMYGTGYRDYTEAVRDAVLLHFTGRTKPVGGNARNPAVEPMYEAYDGVYEDYLSFIGRGNERKEWK